MAIDQTQREQERESEGAGEPYNPYDIPTGPSGPGAFQHQRPGHPTSATPKSGGPSGSGGSGPSPGPSRSRGVTHTQAAPGIFDDYSGPQVDAAKTIVKQEMALLGWPQSVDTEQMALDVLKNNLENRPQDAYEHFWNSKFLTNDMRKANPWARFGQDADTFHANLASAQDLISRMTGINVELDPGLVATADFGKIGPPGSITDLAGLDGKAGVGGDIRPGQAQGTNDPMALLLQNALKFGWSQQQIMDAFQAGSFMDIAGKKIDLSGVTAAEPWLMSGQTFQQQEQQFRTIYGAAPVDTAQLAGWFRFNQTAAQIGPWYARQAVTEAVPKTPMTQGQQSIVR